MPVTDIQALQSRLTAVKGKIEFLKHEKQRVEKEQQVIREELKLYGVEDITQLQKLIAEKEADYKTNIVKFTEAVGKLESTALEMERQVAGNG